jgi:hypothetical protein
MFVRRVVVADRISYFAGGYGLIEYAQKPRPPLMAVVLPAQPGGLRFARQMLLGISLCFTIWVLVFGVVANRF